MEVKTPREFFENVVMTRFNPDKARNIDATVQVELSGPNGGNWYVVIKDQKLEVKEGVHANPTLSVKMKDTDYVDMVNGKISGPRAYMTGKLKLKGDTGVGMKLRGIGIL